MLGQRDQEERVNSFQGPAIPLLAAVTIDCADPSALSRFWADLLGVEISHESEQWVFLAHAPDRKVTLWFQRVPEPKVGKNRVHVDFGVLNLEAAEERVVELGGTLGERHTWQRFEWRTCFDPEGNEFDIARVVQDAA